MKRVVVDPVTRIEGHLRVEIKLDEATGKVEDALSSGTAWRGLEVVVKDRDPRDIWAFVQRICGVCTGMHAISSLRAVEDALGIEIPKNANSIRNIMLSCQNVHDHLVHFYHLHALDWVSPVAALKADPKATGDLQNAVLDKYSLPLAGPMDFNFNAYPKEFPKATTAYYKTVQDKIKKIVENGQLGIFSAQWWDHPDYEVLPPEVHLLAVAHYLNMLDRQRDIVVPHVIFGGKNPHPHFIVGGMPCAISMNDMNAPINTERLAAVDASINATIDMVNSFYVPDVLAIGELYVKKGYVDGGGLAKERVLGFGDFPDEPYSGIANGEYHKKLLLRCDGVVENFGQGLDKAVYHELSAQDITDPAVLAEGVDHSWYSYPEKGKDLHPWEGDTEPQFTGPKEGTKTQWKYLDENAKYSWLKTPKWKGKTAEVGPLARYIIVYTKVKKGVIQPTWVEKMVVDQIEAVSKVLSVPPEVWLPTTVGRTAARALETQLNAYISKYFFDKLIKNIRSGDTSTANTEKWDPKTWPEQARGVGLTEAPRGALSHWIVIKDGKAANYQAVVPTTWNACPRDSQGVHGAYEACMIDTKVKVADKPLEILKAVRSFDPCLACSTHLYDTAGKPIGVVHSDPYGKK
ncbi:MAG: Cytochrome-c3 hydrogenase [Firmicutes bacterium]|nr:Cytochrome-c3 hydrogenase [Bacillota bacterium]